MLTKILIKAQFVNAGKSNSKRKPLKFCWLHKKYTKETDDTEDEI